MYNIMYDLSYETIRVPILIELEIKARNQLNENHFKSA